ncbi:L-asparaginase 2 [Paraburkholderia aspalathi]|uniref:L-asparaginase 2 n=1 Tax=Paraburkholderia aspalathi TaxID=1324617 RepID=A0ABN7N393_9BURK|nr:asparaginase [Paraburkholderia aspalathi]MBK3823177.1 asparaginase [Paraburkholderia aspalathi]MBK3834999.1 asparaginase [Paraburkholderia aspalathi]MBK3864741.1 asparaginase [Paraburkholderia aspalathi]CAE6842818.1 L-asparaginase 2 [Paraburkholderia aspalathi]CAE6867411.1 L-asparaginase 2 [Paraburkholderia aspalathi]
MTSSNRTPNTLRQIVILGVGGTIAASAASATQTHDYKLTGTLDTVLEQVPQLGEIANIRSEQVVNVASHEVDNAVLLRLASRVNEHLADPAVDGVVITHGTDTLEETTYFLHLVVKIAKPVVVTGAMRPSSALSADGPLNLYNAVRVAISEDAAGMGVLVVLDERVVSARDATKTHTSATDAFRGPDSVELGALSGGRVRFAASPLRRHTCDTSFDLAAVQALPQVDIVYGYQNAGTHFFRAAIEAGARGIVFAATGNGSLSEAAKAGVLMARERGVAVVRSSRVAAGAVSECADDACYHTIAADTLNPPKARILLMLGLAHGMDTTALRRAFEIY